MSPINQTYLSSTYLRIWWWGRGENQWQLCRKLDVKNSFSKGSIYLKAESKKRASYLTCQFVYFTSDSVCIKTWLNGCEPAQNNNKKKW